MKIWFNSIDAQEDEPLEPTSWFLDMADRVEPFVVQIAAICCFVATLASIHLSNGRYIRRH